MDMYWVEAIRNDFLTEFFLIFPFFASSFFYITFIAVGYWLRPGGKTFNQLGFLVPFATIVAAILKNSFQILRPPVELQLVRVESAFGFPSADVLVAVVFWGVLFQRSRNLQIKVISILFIISIALSRIYLGVHSISDSIGGLFFGLFIMGLWHRNDVQLTVQKWFTGDLSSYWTVYLLSFAAYLITYDNELFMPEVAMSLGALFGYGVAIPVIRKWQAIEGVHGAAHFKAIALSYFMLILVAQALPLIEVNEMTMFISGILEYAIIIMLIFAVFPRIIKNEIKKEMAQKLSHLEYDPGHDIVVNYKSLTR